MDQPGFALHMVDHEGVRHIKLEGELDLATVNQLLAAFDGDGHTSIIVDTTELAFIDSTGIQALVQGRTRFGPDRFTLIIGERTRRVLDLSGTSHFFPDSRDA